MTITIYNLKPKFQNLLRPICNFFAKKGITANQVTITACVISLITGILIILFPNAHWPLALVPLILFVRMALNAIDGMLAREHNMKSALGAFLNELGDVFSDAVLYLPFAFIPGISSSLIVIFVLLATISEMTGVVAIQVGASRRYDGPSGKSDRAFVFGCFGLLLALGIPATIWVNILLCVMIVLLIITIGNRIKNSLREIKLP